MLTRRQFASGLLTTLPCIVLGREEKRTTWSKPVGGLRMGLELQDTKHGRALRVLLENTGQVNLGVLVAWNGNGGVSYEFQFHLKRWNTPDEYVFGGSSVSADPPAELVRIGYGLVIPVIWRLDAGSIHSLVFPLDEFWEMAKGVHRDLDLRLRSSELNVRLKVDQKELDSPMGGFEPMKDGHYWVGDLAAMIAG